MPTTRPRHLITETDAVAQALDEAARRWPELGSSRAKLLVRLVEEGQRALSLTMDQDRSARVAAIRRTGGVLTGSYDPD